MKNISDTLDRLERLVDGSNWESIERALLRLESAAREYDNLTHRLNDEWLGMIAAFEARSIECGVYRGRHDVVEHSVRQLEKIWPNKSRGEIISALNLTQFMRDRNKVDEITEENEKLKIEIQTLKDEITDMNYHKCDCDKGS